MSRKNKTLNPKARKNGAIRFYVQMTLLPGRDDDLIKALQATPIGQVAAKVREMMRNGISTGRFLSEAESGEHVNVNMDGVGVDL